LHTICSTLDTLDGEMKTFCAGCSLAISLSSLNAKPVLAEASCYWFAEDAARASRAAKQQSVRNANQREAKLPSVCLFIDA
jgi:hypothetical protein